MIYPSLAPTTHIRGGTRGACHVPVRTTTFPLARSAYMNNSSSEMIVVMTIIEGEERNQGAGYMLLK
jgi:hypothetical protein